MPDVTAVQRIESGTVAVLALVSAIVLYPDWWWVVLAAFVLFDVSMVGYARSPSVGAASYNLVHTYAWPAVLASAAVLAAHLSWPAETWLGITACAWAFHVGVDRALGYGLKLTDGFTHTHLGHIGRGA
ncbi:DUF4260 family protein [Cellulosimicrobium terreum]|nr:DUF4260 family protein [Cellulosimicrobium terreum]